MRIAITGNIGCGKSTVCRLLGELLPGYAQFSVDDAVRALYGRPAYAAALAERFGTSCRRTLSDRVFADPALKRELEDFTMVHLLPAMEAALAQPDVVVEFPLLYEMPGWAGRFDFVLALGCDEAIQRARVLSRDGVSTEKFEQIKAAQLPTKTKAELADAYVDTGVTLGQVRAQLVALLPRLGVAPVAAEEGDEAGDEAGEGLVNDTGNGAGRETNSTGSRAA